MLDKVQLEKDLSEVFARCIKKNDPAVNRIKKAFAEAVEQPLTGNKREPTAVMGKDEWLTPPWLLERLGAFDLDPCAPVVRPWPMAKEHYTIKDNGLSKQWHGRMWCNPPYGREASAWLEKCGNHGNAIVLIFARTETDMFFRYVWEKADALFFLSGRLYFHHVSGECAAANSGAPSVLVAFGSSNAECLKSVDLPEAWVGAKLIKESPLNFAQQSIKASPSAKA